MGIDSPTGRIDTIPSSLTGGMLRYFTPYPLKDLLESSQAFAVHIDPMEDAHVESLPLLISGALSFRGGQFDQRQSSLLVDINLGKMSVQSVSDLLAFASRLGIRMPIVRREMVYADAPIPSMASIIFAHHESVPALVESLVAGMNREGEEIHPYLAAIITGFFCAHVHPFLDGNGRWSRMVAAATGARLQAFAESYLGALYISACKNELIRDVWSRTRIYGIREYVERALLFRKKFLGEIKGFVIEDTNNLLSEISSITKTRSSRRELLMAIYSNGGFGPESMRAACNVSRKVADGRVAELRRIARSYCDDDRAHSFTPPWQAILDACSQARRDAMKELANQSIRN